MSYDGIGATSTMLDSLHLQLREAELRRADAERAHQVCFRLPFLNNAVFSLLFVLVPHELVPPMEKRRRKNSLALVINIKSTTIWCEEWTAKKNEERTMNNLLKRTKLIELLSDDDDDKKKWDINQRIVY